MKLQKHLSDTSHIPGKLISALSLPSQGFDVADLAVNTSKSLLWYILVHISIHEELEMMSVLISTGKGLCFLSCFRERSHRGGGLYLHFKVVLFIWGSKSSLPPCHATKLKS